MIHIMEADGIQLNFGLKRILSDVYINCETGKITGLLGRNGEGKTCLMNVIYGTIPNEDKSIRFDKKHIVHAFKRPDLLLYLPQFHFVPKSLTLKRIFNDFQINWPDFEKDFPEFSSTYKQKISDLSGGHRRLIEIYVIIKSEAQFVMLDEPFTHIMPAHMEKIKEILIEEKQKKGILITDHLYNHITGICDDLYILVNGKTWLSKSEKDLELHGYIRN